MIYSDFQDKQLSQLGFGTMRLPTLADGSIDQAQTEEMTAYALAHGINYFDTAYPYHGGDSERVMGRILSQYPRESFFLTTKYPGHQISSSYDPAALFEEQLEKCRVDYFDFYLLHNINEDSISTYLDPRWGMLDYFKHQKQLGRIRHLGFSCHGRTDNLRQFLDACGQDMEFCQIQLNWLDWTLQDARAKYELLTQRGIPVWVMEPLRGGKLAALSDRHAARLAAVDPARSAPEWSFRFLQSLPNVKMILSGMSDLAQMKENAAIFQRSEPLDTQEMQLLLDIAEQLKDSIPCTACRYCCDGCPMGLDIPMLLSVYNDIRFSPSLTSIMGLEALPEDKRAGACIACGKCTRSCPQNIDIPGALKDFTRRLDQLPNWPELCRQREAAAKAKHTAP